MFSFYGTWIQVKYFGRNPAAQQCPVQILLVFSDVWTIALEVFFGVKLWKMKIQGHKSLHEIEFPEPEFEQLHVFHWNRCWPPASLQNLPRAIHHRKFKVASVCATFFGICNLLRKGFNCLFGIQIFITKNVCYVCNVVVCNVLNSQRCVLLGLLYLSSLFPL